MRSQINLKHPPRFALPGSPASNPVVLSAQPDCRIELFLLAEDIIRVLVLPDGETRGPRTWAIAPGMDDVPLEGRERRDLSGFTPPPFTVNEQAGHVVIETARVRVSVALEGGACAFDDVAEAGLLIEAHDGDPAWAQFWDEVGALPYLSSERPPGTTTTSSKSGRRMRSHAASASLIPRIRRRCCKRS